MGAMLTLTTFCGCAGMFMAGVPINADKDYPEYLGVKLTPLVFPAAVITNGRLVEKPYIHMPYNEPYGKKIADVPRGTVITIDHIVREYNAENEIYDYVMGKIDVPGYSGSVVVGVCNGREHWVLERCVDSSEFKIM